MQEIFTNYLIPITMVLLVVAAALALVGSVISSLNDPKKAMGAAGAIVILVVLYGIGYGMADAVTTERFENDFGVDAGMAKHIGASLNMLYFMFFIAIASVVYNEISKLFR